MTQRVKNPYRVFQHSVIEPRLPDIDIVAAYEVTLLPAKKASIAQLVRDGFYKEFDRRILQPGLCRETNFVRQTEVRTATLIGLSLPVSRDQVIQSLERKGLRPLSAREFMCFGKSNHCLFLRGIKYPIITVGASYWDASTDLPYEYLHLDEVEGLRYLKLKVEPENGWSTEFLFIGFPITDTEAS